MPTTAPQNIAALLGSRICHDLISPIGAISNGVELLEMPSGTAGPEVELIHESVDNANARIRFFRIAFGLASEDQRVSLTEVRDILADLGRGNRLTVAWESGHDLPRREVKLIFLLIQCLETAMPWGGAITIAQAGADWVVTGTSDRLKEISPLWTTLQDPDNAIEVSAAEVQFLLFPELLREEGRRVSVTMEAGQITVRF